MNPFKYCGEYFDKSSGTYYLRARYYNPAIGRFITEDTYWGEATDPLTLNLYIYCSNNPIIFIDPSGHKIVLSEDATDEQKEQYYRAIEYLRTSEEAAALIDSLEALEEKITIVFNEDANDGWNLGDNATNWQYGGDNILNWNPYLGLILGDGTSVFSPALALAHEMGHAHQELIDGLLPKNGPVTWEEREALEKDNIDRFETPIARQLGEHIRKEYGYVYDNIFTKYFITDSSTDWGNLTGKYEHSWLWRLFNGVKKSFDREFINKNNWKPRYVSVTKPLIE